MRPIIRRTATFTMLGAIAIASSLPAAAQSGRAQHISQRQSILTELSPTGEPGTSRVFTQLTVQGDGPVTVSLPEQSTSGLRKLDGFGNPDVEGDAVIHTLDPSGEDGDRARTVADNTAEVPVTMSVRYLLDGQEVDPDSLAGEDGTVEVEYTIRNLTAEPTEIVSFDAENNRFVETMDVAVPMVGTLSLTLPPSFANIDAPGAVTAGDGRGNTVVNYSLLLFSPLGSEEVTVSWTADSVDTAIPNTSLQVLPVDDQSFTSLANTAEAYKGASGSLSTLANGALIINSNLLLLGSGAAQLLDGLGQLEDGASQLNDGLANTAAPGARELANGMSQARAGGDQLAAGLPQLASGAGQIADGLNAANAGGGELSSGLGQLAAGATQVADGLGTAEAGGRDLSSGLGQLAAGAVQLSDGLGAALTGSISLSAGVQQIAAGNAQLAAQAPELVAGLNQIAGGTAQLAANTPTLAAGAASLEAGLAQIQAAAGGFPAAAAGLQQIADGLAGVDGGLDQLIAAVGSVRTNLGNIPGCNPLDPVNTVCGVLDGLDGLANVALPLLRQADTAIETQTVLSIDEANAALAGLDDAIAELEAIAAGLDPAEAAEIEDVIDALVEVRADVVAARDAAAAARAAANNPIDPLTRAEDGVARLRDGFTRVDPNPTAPGANPGLLQAMGLIQAGLSNPACVPTDPQNPANPCGLKQVVSLLLRPGADQLASELGPGLLALAAAFGTADEPGELTAGAAALAAGAAQVDAGVQQLAPGAAAAAAGSAALSAGAAQLAAGGGIAATGAQDLVAGLRQLDAGAETLAAGNQSASAGARTLVGGLGQLAAGATQVADGNRSAFAGSQSLVDGLGQLADGANQLAPGAQTAADGATQLADGLGQLDDGATRLADGLGDAADGSGRLAEGLGDARDGGERLADGTVALQEGFESQLIGGVSAGRQGASQDYEQVRAVIARGKEGANPYGIAAGAEATTVYQFDLAGVGNEEGPSTGLLAGLAVLALAAVAGLGFALRRTMG